MNNHKDRSPLDFLIFGILLYLISMGFGRDASADFIGDPPNSDPRWTSSFSAFFFT
jgi:hypothetical protein